jgi:hypothetical protein
MIHIIGCPIKGRLCGSPDFYIKEVTSDSMEGLGVLRLALDDICHTPPATVKSSE